MYKLILTVVLVAPALAGCASFSGSGYGRTVWVLPDSRDFLIVKNLTGPTDSQATLLDVFVGNGLMKSGLLPLEEFAVKVPCIFSGTYTNLLVTVAGRTKGGPVFAYATQELYTSCYQGKIQGRRQYWNVTYLRPLGQ